MWSRDVAADLLPQLLVLVALAQRLVVDQGLVGAHARGGVDVVALGLADERIEHGAGEVALARQPFQAGDQGVLVGAVQRVARLEGDDALPALLGGTAPASRAATGRTGRTRDASAAAARAPRRRAACVRGSFMRHAAAGMVGALGAVDALDVVRPCPRERRR